MRYSAILMGIVLFLAFQGLLQAEPQLDIALSDSKIAQGKTTILTLQAEWPEDEAQYSFALPELRLENLFLDYQGESQESFVRNDQKWVRKTFIFTLKTIRPGPARIQAFSIPYIDPNSLKSGRFTVSEQQVTVTSAAFNPFSLYVIFILSAVLLVAGGGAFWIYSKKARRTDSSATDTHENQTLALFKKAREAKKQQPDLLHDLSVLLHEFIISFYRLSPGIRTEQEILDALRKIEISRDDLHSIKQLFERFHEAKFTGIILTVRDMEELYRDSLRFMEGKQVIGNP